MNQVNSAMMFFNGDTKYNRGNARTKPKMEHLSSVIVIYFHCRGDIFCDKVALGVNMI